MTVSVTITNSGNLDGDLVLLKGVKFFDAGESRDGIKYAKLSDNISDIVTLVKDESIQCTLPVSQFDDFAVVRLKGVHG